MDAKRKKAEALIYQVMDALDPSKQNSNYYKAKFAKMTDKQFYQAMAVQFPFKFQYEIFNIDPTPKDVLRALKVLNVPLMESINLPYLAKDKDGNPIQSKPCQVGPLPIKKMKQMLVKKVGISTNTTERDMRTGLETGHSKNANTSDREFEALTVHSLDYTTRELMGPRADAMDAKAAMYNHISVMGDVSLKDIPEDPADSLSRNMFNAYLIGSILKSNLIDETYHLRKTLEDRKTLSRED